MKTLRDEDDEEEEEDVVGRLGSISSDEDEKYIKTRNKYGT
jgi:hypothetical protein